MQILAEGLIDYQGTQSSAFYYVKREKATLEKGLKVFRVELPYFNKVEIIPLADLHIGDAFTVEQLVKDTVSYIMEKPYRFVILNGDLMNMALKGSKSDVYSEKYSPSDQVKYTAELLKPLWLNGRILAMQSGNHEDRVYEQTGIDISAWLAAEMGLQDRYNNNSFVLFVKFGRSINWTQTRDKKNVYSFYVRHGVGAGGRKSGGKLNKVMEMSETIDCDVYIMSHVHDPILKPSIVYRTDNQNMTIYPAKRDYIITNAFQSFGGYGQKLGFNPASNEISYITLNGNGKKKTILTSGIEDKDWKE